MNTARNGHTHQLVGQSTAIEQTRRLIAKAARSNLPVLLLGETGTGKEVAARAIYDASPAGQFVPIDCGSLVGTLMESELFGHTRGAFSGALEAKKGLVELADGGTAFFDEIGDLPLDMQVKLLRLLQEREFRAVGAVQWRKLDLRLIAATHRNLRAEVEAGRFRQDLYYRLNVFAIHLPPLRDRKEDIPLLIEHFLEGRFDPGPEITARLMSYDWPGNVRELRHCLERLGALRSEGALRMADLPSALQQPMAAAAGMDALSRMVNEHVEDLPYAHVAPRSPVISIPESERQTISAALAAAEGRRDRAAKMLGIGRTTLYRKMKEYGMA
jgi:DNA-binding NtrC family response regulator